MPGYKWFDKALNIIAEERNKYTSFKDYQIKFDNVEAAIQNAKQIMSNETNHELDLVGVAFDQIAERTKKLIKAINISNSQIDAIIKEAETISEHLIEAFSILH